MAGEGAMAVSMRDQPRRWRLLAWGLWLTALLLAAGSAPYAGSVIARVDGGVGEVIFILVVSLGFASVGAVVASRRPRHPIGWMLLGSGWLLSLSALASAYAHHAVLTGVGDLRLAGWAGVVEILAFVPGFFTVLLFLPLLFPDGRLLSP